MSATSRVHDAYARLHEVGRSELWISLVDEREAVARAQEIDGRVLAGEELPLAGLVGALKDNIDLAGLETTAGCPAYAYRPVRSATCVDRLIAAGLIIIGKTNLDQFATGLVGTRSPYGAIACVTDPDRVGGGSSSGSALAVALEIVDVALGTDTAGSGRVPAAFNGIIGLKPTRGLISTRGVVPACPSIDCVSIFARDVATAFRAFVVASGEDREDPMSRKAPSSRVVRFRDQPVIGVADPDRLLDMDPDRLDRYRDLIEVLVAKGHTVKTVDIEPLVQTGALLYGGALVAERYASVGAFVDAHPDKVDPTVGAIISAAREVPAHVLSADLLRVQRARRIAEALFCEIDLLALPTAGVHPTFDEVEQEPLAANARVGTLTTFCNLLDLAAIAIPLPGEELRARPSGETSGLTFFGPAFSDSAIANFAADVLGESDLDLDDKTPGQIVVVGAHLRGEPLNHQLVERDAVLEQETTTDDGYRLVALDTVPPKPGLVRVGPGAGAPIEVEIWRLSPAQFAHFVDGVVSPLAIGPVRLADGRMLPGFLLAAASLPTGARDITAFGGWRRYLAATPASQER